MARNLRSTCRRGLHMTVTARGEVLAFEGEKPSQFHGIVGHSPALRIMIGKIAALATSRSTVLIVGESGTGKELIARAIHRASAPNLPFVALNCAALPKDLIESELFGYVRGAFSGANQEQLGLFRSAQGGTLFLDEITEMSPETQAKLLRAIQERCVRPVGGTREIPVDVRIIASTNREPEIAVRDGQLRKDLYYRLAVGVVRAAPLRERTEDLWLLVRHFIDLFNERFAKPVKVTAIEAAAFELLTHYQWPGNVRELGNAIEAALSFSTSEILQREDFALSDQAPAEAPVPLEPSLLEDTLQAETPVVFSSLKKVERDHIVWTLYNTGGNKALAARMLGISRKSLYDRLAEHGLADSIRSANQAAVIRHFRAQSGSEVSASRV
jgi:transcriptional regulator with PAS, ATPase and Fis domain